MKGFTDREISECALCSYGAVRKARADGRLETFEDIIVFCLAGRLKKRGIGFMDDVGVSEEVDLHYTPDDSQREENRTGEVI